MADTAKTGDIERVPAIVKEAMERWKASAGAFADQEQREAIDLAFQLPENAWTDDAKKERQGQIISGVALPPRPMMSIPTLDQPIAMVLNQEKSAHLGVTVHALDEDADDDTAEVQRDLYRTIERDSRAHLARTWAFDRAVKCGRGAYRVLTEYDQDSNHPFDQKIVIKRILQQQMARFDPAAQEPDWCDGEWALIGSWLPLSRHKTKYPKAKVSEFDKSEFADFISNEPEWANATDGDESRAVLVVEYYRKVHKKDWVVGFDDGSWQSFGEKEPAKGLPREVSRRDRDVVTIEWHALNGREVLEGPTEENGQYIPVIPAVGRELQPIGGKRIWVGMIGPNKDSVRLVNFGASTLVENAASEPKTPWRIAAGSDTGFEHEYQQANIRNMPAVHYNAYDDDGRALPPPDRVQVDTNKMALSMMLLDRGNQFIQAGTLTVNPAQLEQLARKRVAHQTLDNLAEQGDAGNSDYLNNLAEISMVYEARVVLDKMGYVYDRRGRVVKLLGLEDDIRTVALNAPFVMDPNSSRPIVLDERGMPTKPGVQKPAGGKVKHFNLKKGKYAASVSIGKGYESRLQQGSAELSEVMTSLGPETALVVAPTYFKFRDGPGFSEVAENMKKLRDAKYPFMREGEEQNQEQQAEQLAQENKQLKAQLQQATEYVQTEKAKYESQAQIKQIEAANKLDLQRMQDATTITVAQINARMKGLELATRQRNESIALAEEGAQADASRQHESAEAQAAREFQQQQARESMAHQVGMGAESHEQGLEAGDVAHSQSMEQQEAAQMASAEQAEADRAMAAEQQAAQAQQPEAGA